MKELNNNSILSNNELDKFINDNINIKNSYKKIFYNKINKLY